MSLSNEDIIEAISSKTLVEVMELVKAMEEKLAKGDNLIAINAAIPMFFGLSQFAKNHPKNYKLLCLTFFYNPYIPKKNFTSIGEL